MWRQRIWRSDRDIQVELVPQKEFEKGHHGYFTHEHTNRPDDLVIILTDTPTELAVFWIYDTGFSVWMYQKE